ncbi:MAG: BatA and WFA domain-containing protein [FCB group bacterium]|jgi:hypothetical protein|nr:BatA and WFA domain-containing protein [FCB group bacterium]
MNTLSTYLAAAGKALGGAFMAPVYFAFLGLIPIVVLLYLLKLRRTHVVVPSTMLWRKSLQDLTANAPFQRLRKNLLMFLQILVLLLLVFGMTRPYRQAEGVRGNNVILLIDHSASMATLEENGTRLDLAKKAAHEMIENMAGGDRMMVVAFADTADVHCELTHDRRRLRDAVNAIRPADTATRLRDAVLVASSLQFTVPDLRMAIIGDGNISDLREVGSRAFDVSYLQIGKSRNNAGIVAFSVRDPEEGQGERQSLVLVHNESEEPLSTTLTVSLDDQALAVETVEVPPMGNQEVVFSHHGLDTGVLQAQLDVEDDLAVDNRAWLSLRPAAKLKILLVSEGESTSGYYLKRVLALDTRVEVSAVAPSSYTPAEGYDVTIFDNFAPRDLPPGTLVFFNAAPALEGLVDEGELANPPIIATDPEHPMMRLLNPSNVTVAKARKLTLPDGARTLISTRGGPLVADVSREGRQMLVVAFSLSDSNWPLRLSFPLFIQNLLAWAPRGALAAERSVATGSPITLLPTADAGEAVVTRPDGAKETLKLDPARPVYYGNTGAAGVYTIARGELSERYAVNLLDRNESSVTPAASLEIGRSEVVAERGRLKQKQDLWPWFVLAAVAGLMIEWWVYTRRAWI